MFNKRFILVLIFLCIIIKEINLSIINIKIQGTGRQQIINSQNDGFTITPNKIYVNNVLQEYVGFYVENLVNDINYITVEWNDEPQFWNCHKMFYNLQNIISVDLIDIKSKSVTCTIQMFRGCTNLISVNFGGFDSSQVADMSQMFDGCTSLVYLNLNNFDASSCTSMWRIFYNCNSLISLNLNNIKLKSNAHLSTFFSKNNNQLLCYGTEAGSILNSYYSSYTNDCNSVCNQENYFFCYDNNQCPDNYIYLIKDKKICTKNCGFEDIYKYLIREKNLCINNCQNDDLYKYTIEQKTLCVSNCQNDDEYRYTIEEKKLCVNNCQNDETYKYTIENKKLCKDNCLIDDTYKYTIENKKLCIDNCLLDDTYKYTIEEKKLCIDNCQFDDTYKYTYDKRCYIECPLKTRINGYECIDLSCENYYNFEQHDCLSYIPEGYYLYNQEERTIDKCHPNCKTCEGTNDHCLSCYEEYFLENNKCEKCQTYCKNCNNPYSCNECVDGYRLINDSPINQKCFQNCEFYYFFSNDNNYFCTNSFTCPENYEKLVDDKKRCIDKCSNDDLYKYEYQKKCGKECPAFTIDKDFVCEDVYDILRNKNETNDNRIKIMRNYLLKENSEKIIQELNKGNNIEYKFDEMTISLKETLKQKDDYNNTSINIDFLQCEINLKNEMNISLNESLILFEIDVLKKGMKIPRIEYQLLYSINGTKLEIFDLKICENNKINIFLPIQINESDIEKYNLKSDYYNDICYKAKSSNNADLILYDRRNFYVDNNLNLCEEKCDFIDYDKIHYKAKCSCDIKKSVNSISDININKTELLKGFTNIKKIINFEVMNCYYILFNKNELLKNYACYIFFPIIILHLILIFLFFFKGKKKMKDIINKVIFYSIGKQNIKTQNSFHKNKFNNKNKLVINQANSNLKQKVKSKINKSNHIKKVNKIRKGTIKNNNFRFLKNPKANNRESEINSKRKINKIKNNNSINKFNKPKINLTINELNSLPYEKALILDIRSCTTYYISLLKVKHIILFTFFLDNDYNSKIVKIDLFFFSIIFSLVINALFFNDSTMHKIYIDEGSYNLEYQITQIAYSTLISLFVNLLLKVLSMTENNIIKLKNIKKYNIANKQKTRIFLKINFYFIISTLLLLFFGYYLACFCAIYENTQIHLIKDTAISFGLGMVYPIFSNIIPGIFRISALNKKGRKIRYKFSQILQVFT